MFNEIIVLVGVIVIIGIVVVSLCYQMASLVETVQTPHANERESLITLAYRVKYLEDRLAELETGHCQELAGHDASDPIYGGR
jgi:hypothetical protein